MATEQKTPMQLEADRRAAAARGDQAAIDAGVPQATEVHTYADGSQRVGVPPFPEKSPLEEQAEEKRRISPMVVPQGMKTSGEAAPTAGVGATEEEIRSKIEQQLKADVASGKDPATINPTTDSNKPELAGTDGTIADEAAIPQPTAEDFARIAAGADVPKDATPEQVEAAAAQVAREVKGPIVSDEKESAKAKKSAKSK